jgi:hypothetical protein
MAEKSSKPDKKPDPQLSRAAQKRREQTLRNQRRKAQTDMNKLGRWIDQGKITHAEARQRRIVYKRIIKRTDQLIGKVQKPIRGLEHFWTDLKALWRKAASYGPSGMTERLQDIERKAGR